MDCQSHRQLRPRRTDSRLRRDGPQDHRGLLRRHGASRRRRLQRQGPVEGRSQRRIFLPLRGAAARDGWAWRKRAEIQVALRNRTWRSQSSVKVETFGTGDEARAADASCARVRLPAGRDHREARPAAANLPADHKLRTFWSPGSFVGALTCKRQDGRLSCLATRRRAMAGELSFVDRLVDSVL